MGIVLKPSMLLLFEPQDEKIGSTQYESLCPEFQNCCVYGAVFGSSMGRTLARP